MKVTLCFVWIVSCKLLRALADVILFPVLLLPMLVYHAYRYHLTGKFLRRHWNAWRPTTFVRDTVGVSLQHNWQEAQQMANRWDTTTDTSERTLLRGSREQRNVL